MEGDYSNEAYVNTGQPQTPTGLIAAAGNTEVQLSWDVNPDSDLVGYAVHRSFPEEDFVVIDTVESTGYLDEGLLNGLECNYTITAIDNFGYSSFFSDTVTAIPMGFDSGILLVNSNRPNPDFDSMTVFYQNILQDYQFEIIEHRPGNLAEIAGYSTILFCKELMLGYGYFDLFDVDNILSTYLNLGGNVIIAGIRQVTPTQGFSGITYFDEGRFPFRYLNLGGIYFPSFIETEFIGGESQSSMFSDFSVDSVRANRIEFPPGDNDGRLFGIGTLLPRDSSEVVYTYEAVNPDTSNFHGLPVGIIHQTDSYNVAVLEFPLYYVEEPISYEILHTILDEFGEVQTDTDEEVSILPDKTVLIQNYPNPFNAQTVVEYQLIAPGHVEISIFNILGQKIAILADEKQEAGKHAITWDASDFPSGVYFVRMEAGDKTENIKMVLLK